MHGLSAAPDGIKAWIRAALAREQPCARQLVMDIFVDALGPHGQPVWLASLLTLAAPLGLGERALRTCVFRLVAQGWLCARRSGRHSAYAIAPAALESAAAARALAAPAPATAWDGGWSLAMAWCERLNPEDAAALRSALPELGYRLIQPGVFGKPGGDTAVLAQRCAALGVAGQVALFQGACPSGIAADTVQARVAQLWELDSLAQRYRALATACAPLRTLLAQAGPEPEQAYVLEVLLRGALRSVRRDDPRLPAGVLPADWAGALSVQLVQGLLGQLEARSRRHVAAVLAAGAPPKPACGPRPAPREQEFLVL